MSYIYHTGCLSVIKIDKISKNKKSAWPMHHIFVAVGGCAPGRSERLPIGAGMLFTKLTRDQTDDQMCVNGPVSVS